MTPVASSASYRFGEFELQTEDRRLCVSGEPVAVGPKAFDLLVVLVQAGGHLVSKDELLEKVWPKVVVEENSLQAQVSALRKILGAQAIATVSKSGYRFTLEVSILAAAALPAQKHNLPQMLTSFVGREKEVAELTRLLGTTRLLTLTGAGGCGKTRLAIRLAATLKGYTDGIWFVELAGLREPALVPQAVASVLGLQARIGETLTQAIAEYMASRKALLLLDNAEHLLDASAALAGAILKGEQGSAILVTSRERLGIEGELTYGVPSLSVPDHDLGSTPEQVLAFESARLFIERVRLQRPHFVVTVEDATALASICRRLDGIPLAIELVAPRLRAMNLPELDRMLDQRFGLLTAGSDSEPVRHRTLRSVIDWTFDLLTAAEQALLCRASVFAGGCELAAVEYVCKSDGIEETQVIDLLASLVDWRLVSAREWVGGTRYRLLETVRQYAQDRLQERDASGRWQARHLEFIARLAERADPHLRSVHAQTWLDRVEVDQDNARAALAYAISGSKQAVTGLRLAIAQWRFWFVRGHFAEGHGWLSALLAAHRDAVPAATLANAVSAQGSMAYGLGDYSGARQLYAASLELWRQLGDREGVARSLTNLAIIAQEQSDMATASRLYGEALDVLRDSGARLDIAVAARGSGSIAIAQQDFDLARSLLEEALALFNELGNSLQVARTFLRFVRLAIAEGDLPSARGWLIKAQPVYRDLRDRWGVAVTLERLIATEFAHSASALAVGDHGAADRLWQKIDAPLSELSEGDRLFLKSELDLASKAIDGDGEFDPARSEVLAWDWEQLVRYVLSRTMLYFPYPGG